MMRSCFENVSSTYVAPHGTAAIRKVSLVYLSSYVTLNACNLLQKTDGSSGSLPKSLFLPIVKPSIPLSMAARTIKSKQTSCVRSSVCAVANYAASLPRELSKSCEPHLKREDEGKFRCSVCTKLFKAESFVEKHIANKHPELVTNLAEVSLGGSSLVRHCRADLTAGYARSPFSILSRWTRTVYNPLRILLPRAATNNHP